MWYLKLETEAEGTLLADLAKSGNVSFSGFPLSSRKSRGMLLVTLSGFVRGSPEDLAKLLKAVKGNPSFRQVSSHGSFLIASVAMLSWLGVLYRPDVLFVRPALYKKDGTEILELASFEKGPLMRIVQVFKRRYRTKILSFAQRNITNISFLGLQPEMTAKQKQALTLAVENGYYQFPRKITLAKLARIMGVSFSTYQAHLAKAEARFIPEMFAQVS